MYSTRFNKLTGYLDSIILTVILVDLHAIKSSIVSNSSSIILRTAQSACSTSKKKQLLPKVIPTILCASYHFVLGFAFLVFAKPHVHPFLGSSHRESTLSQHKRHMHRPNLHFLNARIGSSCFPKLATPCFKSENSRKFIMTS